MLVILLFGSLQKVSAQITYDWVGTTSTAWNVASNWQVSGGVATISPALNTDVIRIGVVTTPVKQLDIGLNVNCASITFGSLTPVTSAPNRGFTITVAANYTLTATTLAINHGINSATQNINNEITFTGGGSIVCTEANIGDNTVPTLASSGSRANVSQFSFSVANLTVTNVTLRTTSNSSTTVNNPTFQLSSGNMTLTGQIKAFDNAFVSANLSRFVTDTTPSNTSLTITSLNAFPTPRGDSSDFDFTNDNGTGNTGSGTVTYAAASGTQEVFTTFDDPLLGVNPRNYDNISFKGDAVKSVHGNKIIGGINLGMTVGGNWTSEGGNIDLDTNDPLITISGSLTNSTTISQGSGDIDVAGSVSNSGTLTLGTGNIYIGGNYANTGTYTQSTGTTVFDGTTQTLTDNSTAGTAFRKVLFTGNGTKTLQNNKFSVTRIGILTLANSATVAAGGNLTLKSSATSSATVAAIPSGSSITGNVNVERYISGRSSITDFSKRGYRLISSSVNVNGVLNNSSATAITTPWYITNKAFVSGPGGTGNGFDVTQRNNPTLYLYRENVAYSNASFTAGNFKAVEKIETGNSVTVTGTTPGAQTTVSVPAGNAYFFYFAGNNTSNLSNKGSVAVAPEQVTLVATGTLNQGSVPVKLWFNTATGLSFASPTASVRGFALVGNPYASTIDWNTFNTGGISSTNVSNTIYQLNLNSKVYATYGTGGSPATNGGTNLIPSGQGFFVKANSASATLTFNEAAKTTTQQSPLVFMGLPAHTDSPGEWLKLALVRDSLNSDEIALWFRPDSKTSLDSLDADDLGGQGNLVSLSSLSDEKSRFLAVNALPYPENSSTIALGLSASASGLYTLQRTELKDVPPLYDIWLKDLLMKDSLDLRQNKTYSFRIDRNKAETFGNGRFQIIIRKKSIPPYELISFTAERTANGNTLTWKVLNEAGYTGFVIERIGGNKQYIPLYEIQSDGKGTYSYTDQNPMPGSNFYRLKQDDINNKIAYSQTIEIKENTHNKAFSIYPNPTSDWLNINMDKERSVKLRLVDAKGCELYSRFFSDKISRLDVSGMKAGIYIIEVTDTKSFEKLIREKWIKN